MAETTGIPWCDHTFNPWIGCQKVSAGCQNCYAEKLANFHGWVKEWGKDYKLTSDSNWKKPIQWAKQAVKDGITRRIFCASLGDFLDERVPLELKIKLLNLFDEVGRIGGIELLLLTKKIENLDYFLPLPWLTNPPDFIRIGTTVENQEMADKRIPILLNSWGGKNFVSVEPMLSQVNLTQIKWAKIPIDPKNYAALGVPAPDEMWSIRNALLSRPGDELNKPLIGIDWVICGCESGTSARPCNIEWIRDLRDQCEQSGTPFFLKQINVDGKLVKEPFLDGRQWLEFPKN